MAGKALLAMSTGPGRVYKQCEDASEYTWSASRCLRCNQLPADHLPCNGKWSE